jgi:hypothetical protein
MGSRELSRFLLQSPSLSVSTFILSLCPTAVLTLTVVPNKHRPLWVGGLLFAGGPLIGFGPIIAQVFGYDTAKSWRWNYYTAIIVAGAYCNLI